MDELGVCKKRLEGLLVAGGSHVSDLEDLHFDLRLSRDKGFSASSVAAFTNGEDEGPAEFEALRIAPREVG